MLDAGYLCIIKPRIPDGYKRCTGCKQIKPLSNFGALKAGRDGKKPKCYDCQREIGRNYRRSLSEEKKHEIYQSRKAYFRQYVESENGATRRRKTSRRYAQKRRAIELELPHTLTEHQWVSICDYWHSRCAICGLEKKLTQDHWIPISDSCENNPGTVAWNIVPLCLECNSRKGNKSPDKMRLPAKSLLAIQAFIEWAKSRFPIRP